MSSVIQGHSQLPSKNLQLNNRKQKYLIFSISKTASSWIWPPVWFNLRIKIMISSRESSENHIRHLLIIQPLHSISTKFCWFAFKTSFECFHARFIYLGSNRHRFHPGPFNHCLIVLPTGTFTCCQTIPLTKIFHWFLIVLDTNTPNLLWAEPLHSLSTILLRPSSLYLHWPPLSSSKMHPSALLQSPQINSSLDLTLTTCPSPFDQASPSRPFHYHSKSA